MTRRFSQSFDGADAMLLGGSGVTKVWFAAARGLARLAWAACLLAAGAAALAAPPPQPQFVWMEIDEFGCLPQSIRVAEGDVILQVRSRGGTTLEGLRLARSGVSVLAPERAGTKLAGLQRRLRLVKGEYVLQLGASAKHRCVIAVE